MDKINVYFISIGDRPFAKYAAQSWQEYGCRAVQITDEGTAAIEGINEVIRHPYRGHMMLFMIAAFAGIKDKEFITTGDDCIINAPLDHAIGGEFDVAICKRTKIKNEHIKKLPYTNGLVVVKHPFFYTDCLHDLLLNGDEDLWSWFGDMECIKNVVEKGGYIVKDLPEKRYCKKPRKVGQGNDSVVLWHYAGPKRKAWMEYHGQRARKLEAVSDKQNMAAM